MTQYSVKIPIERQRFVEGRLDIPDQYAGPQRTGVMIAHGAANDMHEPLLLHLAEGLSQAGCLALRFNFPYRTEGRQRPDSQRVLESAWLETVKWLRNQTEFPLDRLVAGGKSTMLDWADTTLSDRGLELQTSLSMIRDADLTRVATDLSQAETAYQASLAVSSTLMRMSLFDYL